MITFLEADKQFDNKIKELEESNNIEELVSLYTFSKYRYRDYKKALKLVEKMDNSYGSYIRAHIHLMSDYSEKDTFEGLIHLSSSLEKNDKYALFLLGLCYLNGFNAYTKDVNKGLELLEKSASLGNTEALINIGDYYAKNIKVNKDNFTKAYGYYLEAIKQGDKRAYRLIGSLYTRMGEYKKALEYYHKLYENNDSEPVYLVNNKGMGAFYMAQIYYEFMYLYEGENTLNEAINWYKEAIKYNYSEAIKYLVEIYHNDLIHPKYKNEEYMFNLVDGIINKDYYHELDNTSLAEVYALYAEIKYKNQDYDSAFKYFLEAYKLDDNNEIIIIELALLYYYGKGHSIDVELFSKLVSTLNIDPIELDYRYLNAHRNNKDIREIAIVINSNLDI